LILKETFFDAIFQESDDDFFLIIDQDFGDFDEVQTTSTLRTLLIQLKSGTEELEIFGTILAGQTLGGPEVIEPPVVEEPPVVDEPKPKVPDWVRNIFIWYAEERISEDELLDAIQFLIDQGILQSR